MAVSDLYLQFSPIIVRRVRTDITDQELRLHLNEVAEYLAKTDHWGLRTVTIVDLSLARRGSAVHRKTQSEWLAQHEAMLKRVSLGTVFVARSQVIRSGLRAVMWLRPPPNGHTVVTSLHDAVAWAIDRLKEHGIAPPDRLVNDLPRALLELSN